MAESEPATLGICPVCWPEFSVPDATEGDTCPVGPHYLPDSDETFDPPLRIYVRLAPHVPNDVEVEDG